MPFLVEKASERMDVGRLTGGSRFNANGVLEIVPAGLMRFDYDPQTLEFMGVLSEAAATNILLNAALLATQARTVTNVQHTLSFYGAGTVTLSGAHAAIVVGLTGNLRQALSFTPSAGTLTLTVTGQVRLAQLEIGARASSYIPTTAAPVTRAADALSFDLPTGDHDVTYHFDDDSTLVLPDQSGVHAISGALARRWIKRISARSATP